MRLLDRRRRPCFWVLGDNRCGPSISGEKEMERGTNRDDFDESVASVTVIRWVVREKERGDGSGTHGPELEKGGSGFGVTGQFLFL